MVGWGRGAKGRVETWPEEDRRRRGLAWPDSLADFGHAAAGRIRLWALADSRPGRLLPWLPVAFGLGIAIYFAAEREPSWWAAGGLATFGAASAFAARRRPVAFPLALAFTALAAGFATATLKTLQVAHPVLARPAGNVQIAGFVEVREQRERSDRIVVRALTLEGNRLDGKPERVRVSVRKGTAPPVGTYVTFRARLNPPLGPLRPGGYDFARDLYFQGIGAVGFVLGSIRLAEPPSPPGAWLRYASAVQGLRDAIDARIRTVVPGDKGAIASALITGKRDAISAAVNDAMAAFGVGPLLLGTGGLVVLCLLKTPLRWAGAILILIGSLWAIHAPQPDVLIAADGEALAVRGADGRLAIHRTGRDAFTVRDWLAADGDARMPADKDLGQGFRCDDTGCTGRLPDGRLVARVLAPDAFEEDCRRAAIVVTTREAPPDCVALTIDRKRSRARGAMSVRRSGDGLEVTAARPVGQDRPWARGTPEPVEAPRPATRPTPRDATPRAEDLEAGD